MESEEEGLEVVRCCWCAEEDEEGRDEECCGECCEDCVACDLRGCQRSSKEEGATYREDIFLLDLRFGSRILRNPRGNPPPPQMHTPPPKTDHEPGTRPSHRPSRIHRHSRQPLPLWSIRRNLLRTRSRCAEDIVEPWLTPREGGE